jgi:hypothetical protein
VSSQVVGVHPAGYLLTEFVHPGKDGGLGKPGHGAALALPFSALKPSMGLTAAPNTSSSSSGSVRLYQLVQQPRWKQEQLAAELQQQVEAAGRHGNDGKQQLLSPAQLQAVRMRVLGLEWQPYLNISVQLQRPAAEVQLDAMPALTSGQAPANNAEDELAAEASRTMLLVRQVSSEPRVWQWPGGVPPSWAGFTVRLKVALLVSELTGLIGRLAAQQGWSGMEQRKREERRLKRQMRDQQAAADDEEEEKQQQQQQQE